MSSQKASNRPECWHFYVGPSLYDPSVEPVAVWLDYDVVDGLARADSAYWSTVMAVVEERLDEAKS